MSDEKRYEINTTYYSDGTSRSTVTESDPMAAARGAAEAIFALEETSARIASARAKKREEYAKTIQLKDLQNIYPQPDMSEPTKAAFQNVSQSRFNYMNPHVKTSSKFGAGCALILSLMITLFFICLGVYWVVGDESSSGFCVIAAAGVCFVISVLILRAYLKVRRNYREQYREITDAYVQCFQIERESTEFQQAYGTEWTRNHPIPEAKRDARVSLFQWELQRRLEDKEYLDCTENTEWARQNPEETEYSYTYSLQSKYIGKKNYSAQGFLYPYPEKGDYIGDENAEEYYHCGELYGHLLWLQRRMQEDEEFIRMKDSLKPSPFFQYLSRDDFLRSSLLARMEREKLILEKKFRKECEREMKREKDLRYKEYKELSKK